jgi:periplasmic divalent cation tolerance protein
MSTDAVVVLCTFGSSRDAEEVGRTLVVEGLAACVNVLPEVKSIYRWKDEIKDDTEALALIKTTADRFDKLRARLDELHAYEVPEIIALPVAAGHAPYLAWLRGG